MSTLNGLTQLLDKSSDNISASGAGTYNNDQKKDSQQSPSVIVEDVKKAPFDLDFYCEELRQKSEKDNKLRMEYSSNINGYAITGECIGTTVLKILNHPVKSYAHKWLPIIMRAALGNAVHDTIQNNTVQFTEQECSMKVPSLRVSVRLDGLIGNNVLVEIKSCPYDDYKKIIKTQQPRLTDFYQTVMYKYILENHLEECKKQTNTRTPPPALDKYNIDTIQFIYVAHDVIAGDAESFAECMKMVKNVKKLLNSAKNKFFFITSLVLNTNDFDVKFYEDFAKKKIDKINWYVDHNKIPTIDDEFVDKSKCFFCPYYGSCPIK